MKRISLIEICWNWDREYKWIILLFRIGFIEDVTGSESALFELGVYESRFVFDILWASFLRRKIESWRDSYEG